MIKTQHAICKVMVGGAICGKRMAMPQASTIGPQNHLKIMHPNIWVEMEAIAKAKAQVKRGTVRVLNEAMNSIKFVNFEILIDIETIV